MDVLICGAGEVGRHAAEVLTAKSNNITVIDRDPEKLALLDDELDVRSMVGNGAQAQVLAEAGCAKADLFVAATHIDEINVLSAAIAKGVGAAKCIARVHHSAYLEQRGLDYRGYLGIDHLLCPEYSTALAIAATLRSPGALAVENVARGKVEMQQWPVSHDARAVGTMLRDLAIPGRGRVVAVQRQTSAFLPEADTILNVGDIVTLIADAKDFDKIRALFHTEKLGRRRVIILGGTAQSVWLCRALRPRGFSVRLFEPDEDRAQELAAKLSWVTVLNSDAVHTDAMETERVDQADAFVALTSDDEQNILAAARAKSLGASQAIAVLQRPTYLHLLEHVGIDRAFSPRVTAVAEIERMLDVGLIRQLASLAKGAVEVFEVRVSHTAREVVNRRLREITFPARCIIAAIQRGQDQAFVPGADMTIEVADTLILIGPSSVRNELEKIFS